MVKQRQMMNNNKTNKPKRQRSRANARNTAQGVVGMPVAWPGGSAVNPGRTTARMVTEVFSTVDARFLNKTGFATWSSQLSGILGPYKFYRINMVTAEVIVTGGAASTYSVAFNVSNGYTGDGSTANVLNDDYAGVATSTIRPLLNPPRAYWAQRSRPWYEFAAVGDAGVGTPGETTAGVITLSGSGGATAETVIGYLVVELELEFHTLV